MKGATVMPIKRMQLLFLVGACSLAWASYLPAAPVSFQALQSAPSVECFDFVEVTVGLERPDAANPFTDVKVEGEFAREGGQAVRVDGFCDAEDGSRFRVRFMPSQPGNYRYTVRLQQGQFSFKNEGRFAATPGRRPGPVRVDPEHPFHFVRDGTGEHWFWNATTTYQLLAWDEETIARSVERLASLGINRIRVALCGRTKDGTRWNEPLVRRTGKFAFKMEPWPAARPDNIEDPGYDVSRFNVPFFRKAERMLRLARERGIVVSVVFYVDGADKGTDPFGKERMGNSDEERYYRYVTARFSAFANIMWDVTNEWHLFRDEAWVNRMGAVIRSSDPYHHMASVHGRGDFPFRQSSWADFAMFQSWDEHGGYKFMLENRRQQAATGRPIPQINEEYGYEDHYPFPWGEKRLWPARIGDNRRRLAWEISMAGCYQTTGERANDGTGAGPDTGGGWVNGRGSDQMTMLIGYRYMAQFFTSFPWWSLEPHEDLAGEGTLLLADPGKRYVAYLPAAGAARFQLQPGSYSARWFNPRTGAWTDMPDVVQSVSAPWSSAPAEDAGDWALLLQAK
jgi:hypothetical protein